MTTRRLFSLVLVTAGIWCAGCVTDAATDADARYIPVQRAATLTAQILTLRNGDTVTYDVGVIRVPERRDKPDSRMISVEFHRLPASNEAAAAVAPIYWLRGGPGFGGLGRLLSREGYYEAYLSELTAIAPVVVVGQRGFGESTPMACPPLPDAELGDVDERAERLVRFRQGALDCLAAANAAGVDVEGYTVNELAHDVADIAKLLNHDPIQLFGNSFGAHSGMAVISMHPRLVARATLSALEGPDDTFDLPRYKRDALVRIATDAESHAALAQSTPDGGLIAAFEALIAQADAEPFYIDTQHIRTDAKIRLRIDGDALRQLAQGTTRGTQWRYGLKSWPGDISRMLSGDFSEASRRLQYVWLNTELDNVAGFSMECGSGISDTRGRLMDAGAGRSLLNPTRWFASKVCDSWPVDLGQAFRRGFVSSVPVVLVHGDWDTSTPFENAPAFRKMFTNQHFVHVKGGSHGAYIEATEASPDFARAMQTWMRTGEREAMPETIILPAYEWQ